MTGTKTAQRLETIAGELTLSPFSPTVRNLTFDDFEDVQLQSWMRDFENAFQDCLGERIKGSGAVNQDCVSFGVT